MLRELWYNIFKREMMSKRKSKTNSFNDWYLEFREEMANVFGVDYTLKVASWTYSYKHKWLYDKGCTPKKAVLEYAAKTNRK